MTMTLEILEDKLVYDGKFIQTIARYFKDKNGDTHVWDMVRRKARGRVVAIAALTPKREVILEKIFRVPYKGYTYELPAGLMDIAGESEEGAARRELLEETGYAVDRAKLLISGPYNAGLLDAKDEIAIYWAEGARFVKAPDLEPTEDIEVIKVPLD